MISLSVLMCPMDCRRRSFVIFSFRGRDEFGRSSMCRLGSSFCAVVVAGGGSTDGSRLVSSGAGGAGSDR